MDDSGLIETHGKRNTFSLCFTDVRLPEHERVIINSYSACCPINHLI